ncbi:type IV pilus modification protein PilV [Sediminicurvatus halobius]|uniref:Type IV pilus modification protein PilV n=1 Tax=Sediminicurvatus halobius TaxID=2182432 RepID=A0A2U2N7T4_9GAMM|nr:type IV pilus modification protein PilV [Spiribacter halobius]PWG65142.1 type IV pilus modification protein PilV [Spiribacter halobius]UEX78909.1 type IV pilus modification protein PilV [Spiribacter halobius]
MQHALRQDRQAGFTLTEVLVAVLVLSIGLLGLAAMQVRALQYNQSAYLRSQASLLAYDVMERMRANPSAAVAGDYDVALTDAPASVTACNTSSSSCSAGQLAAYDLATWQCQLGNWSSSSACAGLGIDAGILPDGRGAIQRAGNSFTVTIQWTDRRDDDGDGVSTVSLDYQTEIRD